MTFIEEDSLQALRRRISEADFRVSRALHHVTQELHRPEATRHEQLAAIMQLQIATQFLAILEVELHLAHRAGELLPRPEISGGGGESNC